MSTEPSQKQINEEGQKLLSEIKERLGHGSIIKIAKKAKKSRQTIYNFLDGKYDLNCKLSGKIIDSIQEFLNEVHNEEKKNIHKMNSIITEFPKVKTV